MFKKILIANRGESAIRIIRACKELGIQTVAVRSDTDGESLHVSLADESYCIDASDTSQSYMNVDAIMCTAINSGADAVHPGNSFLCESNELAKRCAENGITFIGPSAEQMDRILSVKAVAEEIKGIGVPVNENRLKGSPKRIDVPFLRDGTGRTVILGDRDSSYRIMGKRYLGETPAPTLSAKLRKKLYRSAVMIADLFEYEGIGNIVFYTDKKENYCYHRFIPRLQKGCAITEMHTRIDIVKWQIIIAAGEAISFPDSEVANAGHTIGCRLSSTASQNMVPSSGRVNILHIPGGMDVRFDTEVYQGCRLPAEYDPMLGVLIVHSVSREEALRKLDSALAELVIDGAYNHGELLREALRSEDVLSGEYNIESFGEFINKKE